MTSLQVDPMLIQGLSEIADRFDHVLLDQWGVLHHGEAVPAGARDARSGRLNSLFARRPSIAAAGAR